MSIQALFAQGLYIKFLFFGVYLWIVIASLVLREASKALGLSRENQRMTSS